LLLSHIEIAKILLNSNHQPSVDIYNHNDYAFKYSIINGHTDVSFWLIQVCNQMKFKPFDFIELSKPMAIDPKHKISKWIKNYHKITKKLEKKDKKHKKNKQIS